MQTSMVVGRLLVVLAGACSLFHASLAKKTDWSLGRVSFEVELPVSVGHAIPPELDGKAKVAKLLKSKLRMHHKYETILDNHLQDGVNFFDSKTDKKYMGWRFSTDNVGGKFVLPRDPTQDLRVLEIMANNQVSYGKRTLHLAGPSRGKQALLEIKTPGKGFPVTVNSFVRARSGFLRDMDDLLRECGPHVGPPYIFSEGIPQDAVQRFSNLRAMYVKEDFTRDQQSSDAQDYYGVGSDDTCGKNHDKPCRRTKGYWFFKPNKCAINLLSNAVQITSDIPLRAVNNACGSVQVNDWYTTVFTSTSDIGFTPWKTAAETRGDAVNKVYAKLSVDGKAEFLGFLRLMDHWMQKAGRHKGTFNVLPRFSWEDLTRKFVRKHCVTAGVTLKERVDLSARIGEIARGLTFPQAGVTHYGRGLSEAEIAERKRGYLAVFLCIGEQGCPAPDYIEGSHLNWGWGQYPVKADRGRFLEVPLERRYPGLDKPSLATGVLRRNPATNAGLRDARAIVFDESVAHPDSKVMKRFMTEQVADFHKAWNTQCAASRP